MADGQPEGSHDNAIGWFILGIVAVALLWLVWFFFQDQIKDGVRWLRWGQMWVLSFIYGDDYTVTSILDRKVYSLRNYLDVDVANIPAKSLNGEIFGYWTRLAFMPLKMYAIGLIMAMGFWALLVGPGSQYRQNLNLDGIINAQSKVFTTISPFVKFNPQTQQPRAPGSPVPVELPLFSEALGPEEWLAFTQNPMPDGKVDEHAAYTAFAKQLGPRWQGPAKLAPYRQVLLACFCLKTARKRSQSDEMLGRLAQCWHFEKGLDLSKDKKLLGEARKILKDKGLSQKTLANCNQHAFQNTALIRALETARSEGGVLAPATFVWMRGYDRTLWYALNNLGRQVYHMEALGALSHYKQEKRTERPIPKPKVEDAVQSISEYMESEIARPIPALDYSAAKNKSGVKQPKSAGVKQPQSAPQKKKA